MDSSGFRGIALVAGAALALAGCSGGGSAEGGGAASVTSSGTITGFGSIYVNGVRYRTEAAEVEFEDEGPVTDDRLRLGMRVTVRGVRSGSEGTASRIVFDSELKGALDADPTVPDPATPKVGSFTVGGFTVTTGDDTAFDDDDDGSVTLSPRDLTGLAAGDLVEVSAFPTTGGFRATRVELEDGPLQAGGFEVEGVVSEQGFDLANGSFEIQGVTIDTATSGAVVDNGVQPGVLVEVAGDPVSGTIVAVSVEVEDGLLDDDFDDGIELEGILERVGEDVFVGGRRVLDPAGALDGFADGARIEVELTRIGDDLVVLEVERDVEDTVRTADEVATVDGDTFTTRLGLEITPAGGVRLEDDVRDDDQLTVDEFLLNLRVMDRIEARGFPDGGAVTWTEIEREDTGDIGCRLRGHVAEGFSDPDLTIRGVAIDTVKNGVQFEDADDTSSLTRAQFFDRLTAGAVVEAKSDDGNDCRPGVLFAQEVSLEPADD